MPWDMRISWHWCTFKCGKVLMVVGAGRGPLVRASLQVSPCSFFIMGCQLVCLFWESWYMYQLYFDWTLFFFSFCLYIGSWRNRTQTENLCCGEKSKCSCYSSCVFKLCNYASVANIMCPKSGRGHLHIGILVHENWIMFNYLLPS